MMTVVIAVSVVRTPYRCERLAQLLHL